MAGFAARLARGDGKLAPMTDDWDDVVADLAARRDVAGRMGGPERITRQHERGKLDVRARIEALFDPGSFDEIGRLAGELPATRWSRELARSTALPLRWPRRTSPLPAARSVK